MQALTDQTFQEIAATLTQKGDAAYQQWAIQKAKRVLTELARRNAEGLVLYRPGSEQAEAFHRSDKKWRLAVGSNRSMKSMTGSAEYARCVLGCDPFDKYLKKNGLCQVVAEDADHLAMLWTKLSEPSFKMIRDEDTRMWRSVRPNPYNPSELDPYDAAYSEQWKDAPPLIPPRMIKTIAWDAAAKGIPRYVSYQTGWKTLFRSSNSKPPKGDHFQLFWIDDEMINDQHYYEGVRGLTAVWEPKKHKPRGIWTSSVQTSNPQLEDLHRKADDGSPEVDSFRFLIEDNPYVPAEERRSFFEGLSEDERATRYYGLFDVVGRRIYGLFDIMGIHGVDPFPIPDDWCRYVILDPGRQFCGTMFVAVDPEEQFVTVYRSQTIRNSDAAKWAEIVAQEQGLRKFEAFICDQQMGRQTPSGFDITVAEQYANALRDREITPRRIGQLSGFFPAGNVVAAREEALIGMMRPRESGIFAGSCPLRIMRGQCANLEKQIRNAQTDKSGKRAKLTEDELVCLEYTAAAFASRTLGYHSPVLAHQPQMIFTKPSRRHTEGVALG